MFSLFNMILSALLVVNSMAILSEERFLARIGWSTAHVQAVGAAPNFNQPYDPNGYGGPAGPPEVTIKAQIINLISAVRTVMRIPLIPLNLLAILYALVWG